MSLFARLLRLHPRFRIGLLFVLSVSAVALTLFLPMVALAQGAEPPPTGANPLADLLALLQGLGEALAPYAGFAALVTFLIDALKRVGVVRQGTSGYWSAGLNLAGAVGLYYLQHFSPGTDLAALDSVLGQAAAAGSAVVLFIGQLYVSYQTRQLAKTVGVAIQAPA